MKELNTFREFLNENEDDGYDRASKELFDMTWDEVRRENDPRMRQAVHDEVQKDDDTYIDDVQESRLSSQGFYEVEFIEMDGNKVTRDFRHFTDENESKQFFNDLKSNPEIVRVTRNELFKGDGKNYLGGSEERETFVNKETDLHRIFLNSRLGDKRFIDEPVMNYFSRRNQARKEVGTSLALNEFDDKSMEDYGDAMKVALGSKKTKKDKDKKEKVIKFLKSKKPYRENLNLEEIYKDIMEVDKEEEKIRKELDGMKRPSQDEVNDAFEKFEREAHYLNNKPVGEWDAADMSNWKSILRKDGKIMESMAKYRVSYTKKDSSKDSIDFIGALNAEDEFYELMDDGNIISAKIEFIGGDEAKVESTWTRDKDGKVSVKFERKNEFDGIAQV